MKEILSILLNILTAHMKKLSNLLTMLIIESLSSGKTINIKLIKKILLNE